MLIYFLKFFHLLSILGLLGLTLYSLILVGFPNAALGKTKLPIRLSKIILLLCIIVVLTGTLLIYPKHFTFHTPWIQAAYLLLSVFCIGIYAVILFKNKWQNVWALRLIYFLLIIILIIIIHDAVLKDTFLFNVFRFY